MNQYVEEKVLIIFRREKYRGQERSFKRKNRKEKKLDQ